MKPKQKILNLRQVTFDESIYPRNNVQWQTTARYYNAMNSGAEFPPIVVGRLGKKYILIDGAHRLQAYKDNKTENIQCEVLEGLTKNEMYIESVKRNSAQGRQFSAQEVGIIIVRLEKLNISQEQISAIVHIPAGDLKPFVAKRITRITETEEDIILKKPFQHLGDSISIGDEVVETQRMFTGVSQVTILTECIRLIEKNLLDLNNKYVKAKLKKLKALLSEV